MQQSDFPVGSRVRFVKSSPWAKAWSEWPEGMEGVIVPLREHHDASDYIAVGIPRQKYILQYLSDWVVIHEVKDTFSQDGEE